MSRKTLPLVIVAGLAVTLLAMAQESSHVLERVQQVQVVNFPDTQKVEGEVTIKGPIRQAILVSLKDIIVSPVSPKDTQRLILGGTIVTDGFSQVVLSLSGQIKGEIVKAGSVGAILLPDDEAIQRIFDERGDMQFPLEVTATGVTGTSPYFASNQPRYDVGFPRYRVLLYNTTAKTVSVNLYAYLSS